MESVANLLPSIPPRNNTPKVCPVIGTGLNGTGTDSLANRAKSNEPANDIPIERANVSPLLNCSILFVINIVSLSIFTYNNKNYFN